MSLFINLITVSRMVFGAIIFVLITRTELYWYAFILFFIASITDYLDGYLARKYNLVSQLGEILDPVADKILIVFLLFAIAVNLTSYYIGFLSAAIITREIWVGALRDFNARKQNINATKVTFLAKIKTTIQLFTISTYLIGISLNNMFVVLIADVMLLMSFIVTMHTGLIYSLNTFKK
ncbi:MAG: CDP-diacylglycerol--glycerol-3-phosphate 3-phosphatidyltransferase [Gammaproteobacteria bacterium]|nr:CDP-diacylglycerol--glycerol-3-phosphate 3-phosphatidyltransferase [Gammaproteobacteria bacterium]|tara:strand:+ start:801 stop:1337 length:537 start_codon:yes stop_codon:yes gene_type:complete